MRLVCFRAGHPDGRACHAGLWFPADGVVADLTTLARRGALGDGLPEPPDLLQWFDLDGPWCAAARALHDALARDADARRSVARDGGLLQAEALSWLPPVPRPGKIVCVGLNYRDHAAEARMAVPESPVIFAKFATALIGAEAPIRLPRVSRRIDFEAELAFVVGRRVRDVPRARAMDAVLGFTNANDVSARDVQKRDGQWVRAKSFDTFAPVGPAVVTLDEIADPHALPVRLRLNGQVLQDSNTDQFVFDVPALVEFIATSITLEPGDLVFTGTPPGVGFARTPPVYLRAGDVVEVEIGPLGVLRNPIVEDDAS